MLRALILLLVLANTAYFAWSQGLLRAWGLAPAPSSEPLRATQQIRPESVHLLRAASAPHDAPQSVVSPASAAPGECLVAGPLDARQTGPLQNALRANFPSIVWTLETQTIPTRWMVYMGGYDNADTMRKKLVELTSRKVPAVAVRHGTLEHGLSLGIYTSEANATRALEMLARQGVRTARVVRERDAAQQQLLRLPDLDPALRPGLIALAPLLACNVFRACAPANSGPTPPPRVSP